MADKPGLLGWFISNPIAANLLMVVLVIGGLYSIPGLDKQFFPTPVIDRVSIAMPFPGASPREVEEQICVRIEEAIHDLDGIKEIRSTASEGMGQVVVEALTGYPTQRLTNEIKTRVDAITTFPTDAERPVVTELIYRHLLGVVQLAGDLDEWELKELGEVLRDDLARQPWISVVDLVSPRRYEVSINVSEIDLRRHNLSFDDVVRAIQSTSLNLPAGAIKGRDGDIRVQTRGQAYYREDFEEIVLLTARDGTQVYLGEVATIDDGFEDVDTLSRFDGMPGHGLYAYVTTHPDVVQSSRVINEWVAEQRQNLPEGATLSFWRDAAVPFKGRVETLLKNGIGGLLLVFLVLVLFLRPAVAVWVSAGIAVAFLGAFFLLPYMGVGLNMISLFAFLLVLGIVVDDAIIVGESIHTAQTRGVEGNEAAFWGVREVFKPVLFAVISTMVFFAPMMFMPGEWAHAAKGIPVVVLLVLTFSLVECLWILPAHLSTLGPEKAATEPFLQRLERLRHRCANWLVTFARERYRPFLQWALQRHLFIAGFFLIMLSLSLSLYGGGWLRSAFFPRINSDFVEAKITMPEGGSFAQSELVMRRVVDAAESLKAEWNQRPEYRDLPAIGSILGRANENAVEVVIATVSEGVDTEAFALQLRADSGALSEAKEIRMDYTIRDPGKPIRLVLASRKVEELEALAEDVREALLSYPGVFDVSDSFDSPRDELVLELKPAAETLGVTLADVARQVRQAFYGAEAQRIPRGREDVKVMVRYPEAERLAIANLNDMYIRTPSGAEVPFEAVAAYRVEAGYQKLERLDRLRTLEVEADVEENGPAPRAIVESVFQDYLPKWQQQYPDLFVNLDGELQEEIEFREATVRLMTLAMMVIYALMAVAFRSYWQPVLILTAVPFGLMGAIFGHMLLGWQVSMFSIMGVTACAGVVVNDNLVLIDRINRLREEGLEVLQALLQAGEDRFRPIILTSLTTFVGLLPIMSETSVQAQFLIPMVTSLAFGVLFATGVTLVLVPALYLIAEDVSAWKRRYADRKDGGSDASALSGA
ncbi:MAG: efflux RND transporter permease subunit [Luminiphilus sp.]